MPTVRSTSRKYIVVSSCPKCGAPIWAEDTNGTAVPENHFTCECRHQVTLQSPTPYVIYVKEPTTVPCIPYQPYQPYSPAPTYPGPTWICSEPSTAAPNADPLKSPNYCGSGSYTQPDALKGIVTYNEGPRFHTTGVISKVSDFGYK